MPVFAKQAFNRRVPAVMVAAAVFIAPEQELKPIVAFNGSAEFPQVGTGTQEILVALLA